MAHARSRGEGKEPYLFVAPSPATKYLTFQAYLEGGEARKITFPQPGPDWLSSSGGGDMRQSRAGGPERGSRAWTQAYTPRGSAGLPKPLEGLLPTPSRPPCLGASHFRPRRLSLYTSFKWGQVKCGFSGQGLEGSLHPGLCLCPKIRTQPPAFPKSRGEASASILARARQPPRLCSRRDGGGPFFPLDPYSVSQSHKWDNLGKSGAAWKCAVKEPHQDQRGERVLGALHVGLTVRIRMLVLAARKLTLQMCR